MQIAMAEARTLGATLSTITVFIGPVDWNRNIKESAIKTMLSSVFSVRKEIKENGTAHNTEISKSLAYPEGLLSRQIFAK
jgi:hypothetical protein